MRLVPTEQVTDGMLLARDIISSRADGAPLLRREATLTRELAARAAQAGVSAVWINDEFSDGIEPAPEFPHAILGLAFHAVTRALDAAPTALANRIQLHHRLQGELLGAAAEISEAVLEYPPDSCPVPDLAVVAPTAAWHALRVTLLGSFVARRVLSHRGWTDYQGNRRFDRFNERITTLAVGLMIHDIGVPHAPDGKMVPDADQPVEHVQAGAALFLPEDLPVAARVVVRNHHERWDGSGYPDHKLGDAIAMNSRIAAIADTYDALIALDGLTNPAAVRAISQGARSQFDPSIVEHFSRLVAPYPVGHAVTLEDGRVAIVARSASASRQRPTVRVMGSDGAPEEIVVDLTPNRVGPQIVPRADPKAAAAVH
ncbi:MAG: HD domain-containing phosphohydrolase [Solirubrobacteraceae bacterium]|jgi:hypothetical protein